MNVALEVQNAPRISREGFWMTPEEKRQGAFQDFDELLYEGVAVDDALVRAAESNGLKPEVFKLIAEKELGDLHDYADKLALRALNDAIAEEVKLASSKRRSGSLLDDCYDLDEVAVAVERRIGRNLKQDEISKIQEARWAFVQRRVQELRARLG